MFDVRPRPQREGDRSTQIFTAGPGLGLTAVPQAITSTKHAPEGSSIPAGMWCRAKLSRKARGGRKGASGDRGRSRRRSRALIRPRRQSPEVAYVALTRMPRLRNGIFTAVARIDLKTAARSRPAVTPPPDHRFGSPVPRDPVSIAHSASDPRAHCRWRVSCSIHMRKKRSPVRTLMFPAGPRS